MPHACLQVWDWQRDLPDHRDYTPQSSPVRRAMRRLRVIARGDHDPLRVDWREFCPPVEDQQASPTSAAHACIAMVQYFERRSSGRLLAPSRAFVDGNARRLLARDGPGGVSLRAAIKAIVRFGLPPEIHWPYTEANLVAEPEPFVYSFAHEFQNIRYCRLDAPDLSGDESLRALRRFLAAGFACVLGFSLCAAIGDDAEIPFPTLADGTHGGHALTVVGYDDKLRIRSDKGALLVRNSWGRDWGDGGYGWLPYAYVRQGLAVDAWTLLKRDWLRSGEFFLPD